MDVFGAVRGYYNQILTEAAFDLNVCVRDQGKDEVVKNMASALRRYHEASECLTTLDQLEQNYKGANEQQPQSPSAEAVNEN